MLDGRTVENPPQCLLDYELCKTFKKLPDELDRQDYKRMQEFLIIHNTIAEHDSKEAKKGRRQEAIKKHGNGGGR
ncbi:hypothetical protein [Bacillus phage Anath]|uniref:Uncharacterized protein n=1 Tax=Bacillus phage Anath TaxID=2108114 RepID=A0A2P1JUK9_9CAUD|nr:hypothetical protein [Bacillus phage Anath]